MLIIEREAEGRSLLVAFLRQHRYAVLEASDAISALELTFTEQPALIVLNAELPAPAGLVVLSCLRSAGCLIPVLVLSSHGTVTDRVAGLTLGADDYLAKPFAYEELLARMRALTRRRPAADLQQFHVGEVFFDLQRMRAEKRSQFIPLSRTECSILQLLAGVDGRPVSRALLLESIWGATSPPQPRTLDTYIWRLHKKVGEVGGDSSWIKSVHGVGYRLRTFPISPEEASRALPSLGQVSFRPE